MSRCVEMSNLKGYEVSVFWKQLKYVPVMFLTKYTVTIPLFYFKCDKYPWK